MNASAAALALGNAAWSVSLDAPGESVGYRCPGETHAISRAVHLGRRAAGHPPCADCPHRTDLWPFTGQADLDRPTGSLASQRPECASSRVRGRWLNAINQSDCVAWGLALGAWLWDQSPLRGTLGEPDVADATAESVTGGWLDRSRQFTGAGPVVPPLERTRTPRPTGPSVVVGLDDRPLSPMVLEAVVRGLTLAGCQVIDSGQLTRPAWRFAVQHWPAAAGVLITSSDRGVADVGWDLVASGARPLSDAELADVMRRAAGPPMRASRLGGDVHAWDAAATYESGLQRHFHALRPLRLVLGVGNSLLARLLERVFQRLPCRLTLVPLPQRQRRLHAATDPDVQLVREATITAGADVGVALSDDGESLAVVDERGQWVNPWRIAELVIEQELRESPDLEVSLSPRAWDQLAERFPGADLLAVPTLAGLFARTESGGDRLGVDDEARLWWPEGDSTCDAVVLLARWLQRLSRSDLACSLVCQEGGGRGPSETVLPQRLVVR